MAITQDNTLPRVPGDEDMPWYGREYAVQPQRRHGAGYVCRLVERVGLGIAVVVGVVLGLAAVARQHGLKGIGASAAERRDHPGPATSIKNRENDLGGKSGGTLVPTVGWLIVVESDVKPRSIEDERKAAYREEKARQMLDDAKVWISEDGPSGRRRAKHRFDRLRRKWWDTSAGQEATRIQITGDFNASSF